MMEAVPTIRFADVARRLGAAARAAGLVVPAFRTPPRRPGVPRTIRRLPGGPVVAVVVRGRNLEAIVADMVEGVLAANGLSGVGAAHVARRAHARGGRPRRARGVIVTACTCSGRPRSFALVPPGPLTVTSTVPLPLGAPKISMMLSLRTDQV